MSPERIATEIDGRRLTLSNLDKVLYPATGFAKRDVIDYYARIAQVMVPHLADRPATLKRYPDGVDGPAFFEKHIPSHAPEWVRRVAVPTRHPDGKRRGGDVRYAVVDDRPTLLWAANLAALEIHVPLWRVGDGRGLPKDPDFMVVDLDPGPGTTVVECCRVALWVRELVRPERFFAKTSGSKGLQLYLVLDGESGEVANSNAHELARALEAAHPYAVVSKMARALRTDKVLVDWSQNTPAKTTVAAYSLRARPTPTVSTPVTWQEVEGCAEGGDPASLRFDTTDVLRRIETVGDLFAPLLSLIAPTTPRDRGGPGDRAGRAESSARSSSKASR